jgi:hypothetical protein
MAHDGGRLPERERPAHELHEILLGRVSPPGPFLSRLRHRSSLSVMESLIFKT